MWTSTASARSRATAAQIFAIYQDVSGWPRWDAGIAAARLDGPFAAGTPGMLQPMGAPELDFSLTHVEPGRGFGDRTPVGPQTAILFRHELSEDSQGTLITHTVIIEGPDAEEMSDGMSEGIAESVRALARYAEEQAHA
jgi:hypothetical protein